MRNPANKQTNKQTNRHTKVIAISRFSRDNNKFELYTDTFDEFSFEELKDEVEEILNIPNIRDDHLEDETLAPRIAETYQKLRSDKSKHDG